MLQLSLSTSLMPPVAPGGGPNSASSGIFALALADAGSPIHAPAANGGTIVVAGDSRQAAADGGKTLPTASIVSAEAGDPALAWLALAAPAALPIDTSDAAHTPPGNAIIAADANKTMAPGATDAAGPAKESVGKPIAIAAKMARKDDAVDPTAVVEPTKKETADLAEAAVPQENAIALDDASADALALALPLDLDAAPKARDGSRVRDRRDRSTALRKTAHTAVTAQAPGTPAVVVALVPVPPVITRLDGAAAPSSVAAVASTAAPLAPTPRAAPVPSSAAAPAAPGQRSAALTAVGASSDAATANTPPRPATKPAEPIAPPPIGAVAVSHIVPALAAAASAAQTVPRQSASPSLARPLPPVAQATPSAPAAAAAPAIAIANVPPAPPAAAPIVATASTADQPSAPAPTGEHPAGGVAVAAPPTPSVATVAQAPQPAVPALAQPAGVVFGIALGAALADQRAAPDDKPSPREAALQALTAAAGSAQPLAMVAAAGGAQHGALDMRRDDWPQAMIDRIDALRDAANAQDTSIRLVPDALGKVDVSIRHDGDAVHVHFAAEAPATQQLIADAQPRLADAAQARGLRLGQTSVAGGNAGAGASAHQHHQNQQGSGTAQPRLPVRPARAPAPATRGDAAGPTSTRLA